MSQTQRSSFPLLWRDFVAVRSAWACLTGKRANMPRDARLLTRTARDRAREKNLPYQQAREDVIAIHEMATEDELTWAEAEAIYDDPANRLLCDTCGWVAAMACPECSGCGCNNLTCSGWRHEEYMHEEERAELNACPECGGDSTSPYGCGCGE